MVAKELWSGAVVVALVVMLIVGVACGSVDVEEPVARSSENYGWLRLEEVTLSGTGTDGAVTASGVTGNPVQGRLYAVHLDFVDGITVTTDITVSQDAPVLTVLQLTDYFTDTWFYPGVEYSGATGSGLSAYTGMICTDYLDVDVGESISGTIGTVSLYWGE